MKKTNKKLKQLAELDQKIRKLPELSPVEQRVFSAEQKFESTYHSNRLEGNKLTKHEARKAVLSE